MKKCAGALQLSAEEYAAAGSDPVAAFAQPIASHMNTHHANSIVAMVQHYVGVPVQAAAIVSFDRCGNRVDSRCTW